MQERIQDLVNIVRLGHIEYRVTDLERARDFYVNLIGLHETGGDANRCYLRGVEDREHHSVILRKAESGGIGHIGFKVASEESLALAERRFRELGLAVKWMQAGEEAGQGRALRVQDPLGFPVEFYCAMEKVECLLQKFHLHRGVSPTRLDHVNVLVPDAQAGYDWYTEELGFRCSEYTETDPPDCRRWASWLFRKPTVHDVAVMTGAGPAVHHAGFSVSESMAVIRACDILASAGYHGNIERGPARHGISNAFFVYVRDPDGNRFEIYTGDYLTSDPDLEPKRWRLNDPQRQTLWGQPAPKRWFEEAMAVESILDGGLMKTAPPLLPAQPAAVAD